MISMTDEGTTEWQLRADVDALAACGNSRRTSHFYVTSIKCVVVIKIRLA